MSTNELSSFFSITPVIASFKSHLSPRNVNARLRCNVSDSCRQSTQFRHSVRIDRPPPPPTQPHNSHPTYHIPALCHQLASTAQSLGDIFGMGLVRLQRRFSRNTDRTPAQVSAQLMIVPILIVMMVYFPRRMSSRLLRDARTQSKIGDTGISDELVLMKLGWGICSAITVPLSIRLPPVGLAHIVPPETDCFQTR